MSDIQRFEFVDCDATGEDFTDGWGRVWIRKDRHVAAVAAAEQRGRESVGLAAQITATQNAEMYELMYRDWDDFKAGVKAARDAVMTWNESAFDLGIVSRADILSAIDALEGASDGLP